MSFTALCRRSPQDERDAWTLARDCGRARVLGRRAGFREASDGLRVTRPDGPPALRGPGDFWLPDERMDLLQRQRPTAR